MREVCGGGGGAAAATTPSLVEHVCGKKGAAVPAAAATAAAAPHISVHLPPTHVPVLEPESESVDAAADVVAKLVLV
jgi:hypothetical protein